MRAVNLIPADQRSGTPVGVGRSEGAAYGVLALCGGLAVLALLYGQADHQISSQRAQAASVAAQAQQTQSAAEALAPYSTFIALRNQRMQAVSTLVDSRFDWAHVFHELGRVLPAGTSISTLSGTVGSTSSTTVVASPSAKSPSAASPSATSSSATSPAAASSAPTSATPPGSIPSFTLTGCAAGQATVARMLERLRLIDGVSSVTLQSSTRGSSSGGGSGSSSSSGCPAGDPAFSVQISFDPLPSASAAAAAKTTTAKTVADRTSAPSPATTPASSGASAR